MLHAMVDVAAGELSGGGEEGHGELHSGGGNGEGDGSELMHILGVREKEGARRWKLGAQ